MCVCLCEYVYRFVLFAPEEKVKHLILVIPFIALIVTFALGEISLQLLQRMELPLYSILKVNTLFL